MSGVLQRLVAVGTMPTNTHTEEETTIGLGNHCVAMKTGLHPQYHTATVTCSCGNNFSIGATVEAMRVELCSNCHPFYTGDQKLVDTAGRGPNF